MNYLITGANGFLGKHCKYLESQKISYPSTFRFHPVAAISHKKFADRSFGNLEFDIEKKDIFNLAATAQDL